MTTITDFEAFLDQAEPDDHEEVYALYKAVEDCTDMTWYECVEAPNGKWIVSSPNAEDKLLLASQQAKDAFLHLVSERYIDDQDQDIEGWYGYKRAMAKDD